MASAFAPPTQPRSPTSINSRRSSNSKCSNVIEKVPVRWRTSLYSRRKQVTREDSPEVKSSGLGFRESFSRNDDKRLPEAGKSQLLRSLYVDQQTGEMRISATDRTINQELEMDGETNHIRRYFPNRRIRSRTQSDTTSPRSTRCVWDQSLKTRSIPINSRTISDPANRFPYLLQSAPTKQTVGSILPRISRSAENIASSYEVSARYPRGQQRPSGLASGHNALLLRHKELVEASKRSGNPWHQRRKTDPHLLSDPRNPELNLTYLHRLYPSLLRVPNKHSHFCSYGPSCGQNRCGQEVTSIMKANRKCLDWFNTWVDD